MPTADATREVVLRLPESLAKWAECEGLLNSDALSGLLRSALIDRELSTPFPDASPGEPQCLNDVAAIVREVREEMSQLAARSG